MAEKKKKIPCRVCGKLFEPCAYCQSHSDVFRWRNFACSKECATKYINDTIVYRESLRTKESITIENNNEENVTEKQTTVKRKTSKKIPTENIGNEVKEENETIK